MSPRQAGIRAWPPEGLCADGNVSYSHAAKRHAGDRHQELDVLYVCVQSFGATAGGDRVGRKACMADRVVRSGLGGRLERGCSCMRVRQLSLEG